MNIKRYHLMIWMLSLNKFLYWKRNSSHLKSQRYILHYLNNNKHKTSVLSRAPNQLGRFIAHSKQTPSFFLYATNKTNALTCNYISRSSPSSWCVFVFLLFHSNFQRQIFPPFLAQNKTSKTLLHFSSSRVCFSFSFSNRYLGQSTCTDAAVAAEGGCCYHAPHTHKFTLTLTCTVLLLSEAKLKTHYQGDQTGSQRRRRVFLPLIFSFSFLFCLLHSAACTSSWFARCNYNNNNKKLVCVLFLAFLSIGALFLWSSDAIFAYMCERENLLSFATSVREQ